MPFAIFRRSKPSKSAAASDDLPLACATVSTTNTDLTDLDAADQLVEDDVADGEDSHAAKGKRLQLALSAHSAHYSSDAAKQAKQQRQERYQRLAKADHLLQNPALTVTLAALSRYVPGVRHAASFLTVAVKIKNTGQEVYLKFNTVYSKVVALIQLVEDLVDRYSGKAAEALSDTHLNTFWDKMQASSVLFEKVTEEMKKFDDVKAWKQFVNSNVWKRVVDELDMMVDDLLADIHTHASLSGLAQQRRLLTQSSQLTDALAHHAKAINAHDQFMQVMVAELQDQANTRHAQHLALIDQIRDALAAQNLTMPYFRTLKNPEIAQLWAFAFGKAAFAMQSADALRAVLVAYLVREYPGMTPSMPEHAAARMLAQASLVAIEDLVPATPRGKKVMVTKLDDAFPLEPGIALPQALCWKVYGWAALVSVQVQSLAPRAATADVVQAAVKRVQIACKRTLVAWNVDTATLRYVLTQLRPTVGKSKSGALPARAQALVDAFVGVSAVVDQVLGGPATDVDWIADPESVAYKLYIDRFPAQVADAVNQVVEAGVAMGLDSDVAGKLCMSPAVVAKSQSAARLRAQKQLTALEHVLKWTSEDAAAYPLDALLADWAELTPAVDTCKRAQGVTRCGLRATLIQLAHGEAERILPRVARTLAVLASDPHVLHVLAIVPPNPDADYPFWGLLVDAPADECVPLELADDRADLALESLSAMARAAIVKHVVLGTRAVHLANERMGEVGGVYPLGISPASVLVGMNPLGQVVARVPPCAGVFAAAGPLDWNRDEYDEFVVPELRADERAWVEGVAADVARRADWYAVGKLVEGMFPELEEGGCEALQELVAGLCQGGEDVDVEDIVGRVVAIGAEAEKRAKPPTPPPESNLPPRPSALPSPTPFTTHADAETAFFTARNRIRNATGPLTAPDYDVDDALALLLAAGDHIPIAYVLAADMYYYGAVPRTPESWQIAQYLYARAADAKCDFAAAGLADVCLFHLVPTGPSDERDRVLQAKTLYDRALKFVDNPTLNMDLTPADRARVYAGLGDVCFSQAQAANDPGMYARARSYYQQAYERDPKSKRVLAKRALFRIMGLGGELVDRELGMKDLRAARSRDNPVHELRTRLAVYEMDGDDRGAQAVRRMVEVAEVPAH
ncbi:hypothetical protein BCR44DRAFT_1427231 [Catenaria anguillulae PL171]|uniref:Uncharacterized protein n=1 Tax=Catenaria anguillulae PL171 TaxID=765915 RepID=A0A1Y2HWW8_9FUNG|nr:hypothetical protein BCR44DRAFT_1427231 [Catenaria anguillulae PL171]